MPLSSDVGRIFRDLCPNVDFCSLRMVDERTQLLSVRRDVLQPVNEQRDVGAMVMVHHQSGIGYAATSDLSRAGIAAAIDRAVLWAKTTRDTSVYNFGAIAMPHPRGEYRTRSEKPWRAIPLQDRVQLLSDVSKSLKTDDRIVDWEASVIHVEIDSHYFTSGGGDVHQTFEMMAPDILVATNDGNETQRRSLGARGNSQQGGYEVLERARFTQIGESIAEEALALLSAPNCPTDTMTLLLAPDQMMLQIHESIGHPLELDRILGDERNYAGTSFVTLDMFGEYQYGSSLLNVSYDPTRTEEFGTFAFDDEGSPAARQYVIERGLLVRPLGGTIAEARAKALRPNIQGVAAARASSWNRPPIDRMSNLNVEAGDKTFDELVSSIEHGILMRTNVSWSIDDSRNKFQFGCEWGQLVENGKLTKVVKNPNYRGISATFWRNLSALGDASTFAIHGVPYCGKGEPNQLIRVGHASPACVFSGVEVFGGAE